MVYWMFVVVVVTDLTILVVLMIVGLHNVCSTVDRDTQKTVVGMVVVVL